MEADTVVLMITIVVSVLVSTLTTIGLLLNQMNRLDDKFSAKIDGLDDKFSAKIDGLDAKFSAKFDVMGRDVSDVRERLARIEGHLMAPEGFRVRGLHPRAPEQPSPEDPGPDHRQAG